MAKAKGLELYADCTPLEELKSYEGELILSRNGKPISFEYNIKFKPNLIKAVYQSNSDHNGFQMITNLNLRYRGVPLELSHGVKGILCSFLCETALENARSPESQKSIMQRVHECLSDPKIVEQIRYIVANNCQGVGISLKPTTRHAREIIYRPLNKFYQDCLVRGLH